MQSHAPAKAMRWECAQLVRDTAVRLVGWEWSAWWGWRQGLKAVVHCKDVSCDAEPREELKALSGQRGQHV